MRAIIGGTGLTHLANLEVSRREVVRTPYGEPSSALIFGRIGGRDAVFLARHGHGHTIPPQAVNYRANLWALHHIGVTHVVAVASVGGIRGEFMPGALAIPDQIIDYTSGRASTFFDGHDRQVVHVDFTHPYTEALREACRSAAEAAGIAVIWGGTYAAVSGPRLETAAEIDRLERDGADMVGMTGMPEAALARELGLKYASIAVVSNHAAGRGDSAQRVSLEHINTILEPALLRARTVIEQWVAIDD
jgi:5'-methylthioadenosine phosphorylase